MKTLVALARLVAAAACAAACGAQGGGAPRAAETSAPEPASSGPAREAAAESNAADPGAAKGADDKPAKKRGKKDDPLFPERAKKGWKEVGADGQLAADAIADDYVRFITAGKTPRRAISALVEMATDAGARRAKKDERGLTGFHYLTEPGGDTAVFFRSGAQPVSAGMSVIVVSVDAPRLILKQSPVDRRNDLEMLQTDAHGELDLRTWMVHPIALDVFVDGKRGKPIAFSVGEGEDDPVLSIPDLLPHLSRGSQTRGREVEDLERLDPLSSSRSGGLARALAAKKLTVSDIAQAEATLIPAGPAQRVGVDRAIIGGYGHGERALAFAAVRALTEATPTHAVVVVVVGRTADGGDGGTGYAMVPRALRRTIAALAENDPDVLDTRLALRRSAALVGFAVSGARNGGVIVDIAGADALPRASRLVTTTLTGAAVPFVLRDTGSGEAGRDIASLDVDAIGLGIPTKGRGTPGETVSVLDLYHGVLACRAWLSRPL